MRLTQELFQRIEDAIFTKGYDGFDDVEKLIKDLTWYDPNDDSEEGRRQKQIAFDNKLQLFECFRKSKKIIKILGKDFIEKFISSIYEITPPTPEQFLTPYFLGPFADKIHPHVRKAFMDFTNRFWYLFLPGRYYAFHRPRGSPGYDVVDVRS